MADSDNSKPAQPEISAGVGASDANNGGGSGSGVPDAEMALRVGDPGHEADPKADRAKLFPEAAHRDQPRDQPRGQTSDVAAEAQDAPAGT